MSVSEERLEIERVPEIPEEISEAARTSTLAVFVGAGVSQLVGCPSWKELAKSCLDCLANEGHLTFGDVEQLLAEDPKKQLSIAVQIAEAVPYAIPWKELITPSSESTSRIYEHLKLINCSFITTNYDELLDLTAGPEEDGGAGESDSTSLKNLIIRPEDFSIPAIRTPGSVVHLHGSVREASRMLVTTSQYLAFYKRLDVKGFLEDLFERYTVLFVGYGLSEWEILEQLLRPIESLERLPGKRFLLEGFFQSQRRTVGYLHRYYQDSFGIKLVPFSKDTRNYEQLEEIGAVWSSSLQKGTVRIADDLDYMRSVLGGSK